MAAEIDWSRVRRVLVVRLRSIGDTVLSTPSLIALKRFLPDAEIDILLEDWVAPILDGFDAVDNVLTVGAGALSRMKTARTLHKRRYDVAFNIHGGTTATFFTFASGAKHRVGYRNYQYAFLYNRLLASPAEFWKRGKNHSAEQQLALIGFAGVPVMDRPRSRLAATPSAIASVSHKLAARADRPQEIGRIALLHPAAAFATKQWAADNFARVAEHLAAGGASVIAVASPGESTVLSDLKAASRVPIITFDTLTLPEITALASKAEVFVGNDSGIAHIAAAVGTPSVVIFGSSNRDHWRPWTDAPNEIVFTEFPCQPCPGHECREFGDPKCIRSVTVESVNYAIDRVLSNAKRRL